MTLTERESEASEHADRALALTEGARSNELWAFLSDLTEDQLRWLVVALANGYLRQEATNDSLIVKLGILRRQNETFDTANANLFREKRELLDKVHELRSYLDQHASSLPKRSAPVAAGRKTA